MGIAGSLENSFVARLRAAERDVVTCRSREDRHVLGHQRQTRAHIRRIGARQVDAIDEYAAAIGVIKA